MIAGDTLALVPPASTRARTTRLLAAFAPVATAYCTLAAPEQVSAIQDRQARWHRLANELRADGAPEDLVAAVGERVLHAPLAPATLAVFAADAAHTESHLLRGVAVPDRATFRAPADVLPWLRWRQDHPAHVIAVVNRSGGEVTAVAGTDAELSVFHFHGDTYELPPDARNLARSALYEQQAFRWGDLVYGFQFHLEFTESIIGRLASEPESQRYIREAGVDPERLVAETPQHVRRLADVTHRVFTEYFRQCGL